MNPIREHFDGMTRRHFFAKSALGLGTAALASLLPQGARADSTALGGLPSLPHFAPKAKRAIYLFMSGAHRRSICSTTSPP